MVPPGRTSSVRVVDGPDPAPCPLTLVRAPPHLTLLRRGSPAEPTAPRPTEQPGRGRSGRRSRKRTGALCLSPGRPGLPSRAEAEDAPDRERVERPGTGPLPHSVRDRPRQHLGQRRAGRGLDAPRRARARGLRALRVARAQRRGREGREGPAASRLTLRAGGRRAAAGPDPW